MSIQLKVSNSLHSLLRELVFQLRAPRSVFLPVYIVTQTEGMNNWLKQQLADRIGIAANIQFLKPNDSIHLLYQRLGGKYEQSISSHDLTWLIYKVLNEPEFIQKYSYIARYYHYSGPDSSLKRMGLAKQLADLFDQYQIYREQMIGKWNQGKQVDDYDKTEEWQKWIWLRSQAIAGSQFPDKTAIGASILEALKNEEKVQGLQETIPTLYFFGLSLITQYHLQIIHAVSKSIDIQFLIQNPAPLIYWFEDKTQQYIDWAQRKGFYPRDIESLGHPLLLGWGKLVQETFKMLFQQEETLNSYQEVGVVEPDKGSLLHHIQWTLFHNEKIEETVGGTPLFSEDQINDETVTINSCYSPIREVETLYNYLVHLIDQKGEVLSSRDILVMVSDIDLYSSYVKAVFDNAPYRFRYTIADESYAVSDSLSNTLMALFSLTEHRFTSEEVLSLLDYSLLRKQFRITEVEKIRSWVETANIRFGIGGKEEDDSVYVSWRYGLKRLMYGLMMSEEKEWGEGKKGFFPLDRVEGFETYEAVRFTHFVEQLITFLEKRNQNRTLAEWVNYVEETIHTFIGEREEVGEEEQLFLKSLERYNDLQSLFLEEMSYDVFIYNFLPTLKNARRSNNFASGGITFCSLIPMRSIPFKVVALLGMDSQKFPRSDQRISFDLMTKNKRLGDRNLKENDKHLFLETLLSAGDYFYLSYVGQSIKDNTEIPPSILVDELLEFIARNTVDSEMAKNCLVRKFPLHGFSKKYNSGDPRLYSYLLQSYKKSFFLKKDKENDPASEREEVRVEELLSFFKNPIKNYYNQILGVYLEEEDLGLPETEIFELNSLQKWEIRNRLLYTNDVEIDSFIDEGIKKGALPLKNMAEVLVKNLDEEVKFVKTQIAQQMEDAVERVEKIDLEVNGIKIVGAIEGIYNNHLVRFSFSNNEVKYYISAYLEYLLLRASGSQAILNYISHSQKTIQMAIPIAQGEAMNHLKQIVQSYQEGLKHILPFYPGLLSGISDLKKFTPAKFERTVKTYIDSYHHTPNPYVLKEYEEDLFQKETAFDDFMEVADLIMEPILHLFGET